jgi:hypothetical protein
LSCYKGREIPNWPREFLLLPNIYWVDIIKVTYTLGLAFLVNLIRPRLIIISGKGELLAGFTFFKNFDKYKMI